MPVGCVQTVGCCQLRAPCKILPGVPPWSTNPDLCPAVVHAQHLCTQQVRFFGKFFGLQANYYVFETTLNEPPEVPEAPGGCLRRVKTPENQAQFPHRS